MINKVTITGADDNTSIEKMIELSEKYPFVEWGILFSESRTGTERYPSHVWLKSLKEFMYTKSLGTSPTKKIHLSGHLCGQHTQRMLQGDFEFSAKILQPYAKMFSRYQLNFNASKSMVCKEFFSSLKDTDIPLILQFNKANLPVCDEILNIYKPTANVHFLYDASGGRGVLPDKYEHPISNHYTGYAGGLSPDNIEEAIKKIELATIGKLAPVWIDTESGVRTYGKLNMNKVERFLGICAPYIGKYAPVTFTFFPKKENSDNVFNGHIELRNVFADENGWVLCPYCKGKHQHGGKGNGIAMGPRLADCNGGEYYVVPDGKKICKKIEKLNSSFLSANCEQGEIIGTCIQKINEIIEAINPL